MARLEHFNQFYGFLFLFLVVFFIPHSFCFPQHSALEKSYKVFVGKEKTIENEAAKLGLVGEEKTKFFDTIKKVMFKDIGKDYFGESWSEIVEATEYLIKDYEKGSDLLILKLRASATREYYFALLSKEKAGWILRDIRHVSSKYVDSEVEIVKFSNHFFVSFLDSGGGTNVFTADYEMFLLGDKKMEEMLIYPKEGYRNIWGLPYDLEYRAGGLTVKSDVSGEYLELPLSVEYYAGSCESETYDYEYKKIKLFSKKYSFRYLWDDKKRKLILYEKKSSSNLGPEKSIFLFKPGEDFLNFFYDDLMGVALKKNENQKEWFKCFLGSLELKSSKAKKKKEELLKLISE